MLVFFYIYLFYVGLVCINIMAPTPLKAVLLAGGVVVAFGQAIDPRVQVEQQQQEIEECRAELVNAQQDERSFRGFSPEGWAYQNMLDDDLPIRYRSTSDWADRSSECDDMRKEQLEIVESVVQVSEAKMSLTPKEGTKPSKPITKNPIGFAMEYGYLGRIAQSPPDPHVINLMANLNTKGSGPALLIGGNSAMLARMNDSAFPATTARAANVTHEQLRALNSFSTAVHAPLTLGVSTLLKDTSAAIDFISRGVLQNINPANIERLELGNEPDHWQIEKKCFRKGNFTFDDFLAEYKEYEAAIIPYISATNIKLQGPAIAGCNSFPVGLLPCWQMDLPRFAAETSQYTDSLSWHRYGNSGCSTKSGLRSLMADPPNDDSIKGLSWLDAVHDQIEALNKTQTCTESGAFSCGGIECLSGTFASTLWGLDQILEILSRNSERVMFHSVPDHIYAPYHVYTPAGAIAAKEDAGQNAQANDTEEFDSDVAAETVLRDASVVPATRGARHGVRSALHALSRRFIQYRDDGADAMDGPAMVAGPLDGGVAATADEWETTEAAESTDTDTDRDTMAGVETASVVPLDTSANEPLSTVIAAPIVPQSEAVTVAPTTTDAVAIVSAGPIQSEEQDLLLGTAPVDAVDKVSTVETEAALPEAQDSVVAAAPIAEPALTTDDVEAATVPVDVVAATDDAAAPLVEPIMDGATTEASGFEAAETIVPVPTDVTVQPSVAAVGPIDDYTVTPPAATTDSVVRANPLFFAMWQMVRLIDDMPDAFIYQPSIALPNYDGSAIKAWAVGSSANHTKVVLIHKDIDQSEGTAVSIEGDFVEPCSVTRLVSNGVLTSTAYLAGQAIGSDGKPTGEVVVETVQPTNGVYNLVVDKMTIVVVDIPVTAPVQQL